MKRSLIVIVTFLSFFLMCNGVKAGENDNYDSNRDSYACANENVFSELLQRDSKYWSLPGLWVCLLEGDCNRQHLYSSLQADITVKNLNETKNKYCADLNLTSGLNEFSDLYKVTRFDGGDFSNRIDIQQDIQDNNICTYCSKNPGDSRCAEHPECDVASYKIGEKSCGHWVPDDQITDEDMSTIYYQDQKQCYLEIAYSNDGQPSYYYASLGPKIKQSVINTGQYTYVLDMGYINKYSKCNVDYYNIYTTAECDKMSGYEPQRVDNIKSLLAGILQINESDIGNKNDSDNNKKYIIEDVAHLGTDGDNYWFQLSDENAKLPDEVTPQNMIYNFNEWTALKAFLPMDNAKISGNSVTEFYTKSTDGSGKIKSGSWLDQAQDNVNKYGLNTKSLLAFYTYGDSMLFGVNSWGRKVYTPFVYKLRNTHPNCTYDEENDTFYGGFGKIDLDNNETYKNGYEYYNENYGITKDRYIQETFIDECLCDTANGKIKDKNLADNTLKYITDSNAREHYNEYCGIETEGRICKPYVDTAPCTGALTVSDDEDCIFDEVLNEDKISSSIYSGGDSDEESQRHYYTTATNEYCNISCAEKIDFVFPKWENDIKAGTYWQWQSTQINSTGTRTCAATINMGKFSDRVTKTDSSTSTKDILEDIITVSNSQFKYKDNDKYSYKQQNDALKELYDSIDDSYDYTDSDLCSCDEYGNNCDVHYNWDIKVDLIDKTFSNSGSCGNSSTIGSSSLKSNGIALSQLKKTAEKAIKTTGTAIEVELGKLKICTDSFNADKESTYDFDPDIKFSYDEDYKTHFSGRYYTKSTVEGSKSGADFDNTDILYYNDDADAESPEQINYDYIDCTNNICQLKATETKQITTYTSPISFFTAFPSGVITVLNGGNYYDLNNNNNPNSQSLGDNIYPIALNRDAGTYGYSFTVSGLGDRDLATSNNSNRSPNNNVGRLDRLIKEDTRTYVCEYSVINDVTTPDKPNFFYRNISVNNFDPNNRESKDKLGKNWTTEKGKATQCEIEGGTYNQSTGCTGSSVPEDMNVEYSFTLTPTNMQNIHKYNLEQETGTKKGYGDFRMTKVGTDITDKNGATLSEGLWYTSDFIRTDICDDCFSKKDINDVSDAFAKWTKDVNKLSGNGPAWK